MKRRSFLAAAAAAPAGLMLPDIGFAMQQGELPTDVARALAEFRKSIPSNFDHDYVEHAVIPFFLSTVFEAERPALPMIDVTLTQGERAAVRSLGTDLQAVEADAGGGRHRLSAGPRAARRPQPAQAHLLRRRSRPTSTTSMYHDKVVAFFDHLFDPQFAGKPFMRHYLDYYFDLYWDLHVGVKGAAIPADVRQIGESFNTVLAYRNPRDPIVYEHYMKVRAKLDFLKTLDRRAGQRRRDGQGGESREDVRVLLAQERRRRRALQPQGRRVRGVPQLRGAQPVGKHDVRHHVAPEHRRRQSGSARRVHQDDEHCSGDGRDGGSGTSAAPFPPLELFVMELFRTISPNGGSLSAVVDARASQYGESPYSKLRARFERHLYAATPHTATSMDPRHWTNPQQFDPDRYKTVPTSAQIDEAKCKADGLSEMPVRHHVDQSRRRTKRRDHEQRIRHGVRRRRRQADAGVRLRRLRAVRLRVSPLPGRTAHDPRIRGLLAQGVEGQDRVRESPAAEPDEGAGWPDGGDRGRHRIQARLTVGRSGG